MHNAASDTKKRYLCNMQGLTQDLMPQGHLGAVYKLEEN